jgi:hypothetical protein
VGARHTTGLRWGGERSGRPLPGPRQTPSPARQ